MVTASAHTLHATTDKAWCACRRMPVMHRPSREAIGKFTLRARDCHALHVEVIEATATVRLSGAGRAGRAGRAVRVGKCRGEGMGYTTDFNGSFTEISGNSS